MRSEFAVLVPSAVVDAIRANPTTSEFFVDVPAAMVEAIQEDEREQIEAELSLPALADGPPLRETPALWRVDKLLRRWVPPDDLGTMRDAVRRAVAAARDEGPR
ncbi:MAG: hypothetical protein U0167_19535 [bacterium]